MFLSFKVIKNICLFHYTNYRNHLVFFLWSDWMIYATKQQKTHWELKILQHVFVLCSLVKY